MDRALTLSYITPSPRSQPSELIKKPVGGNDLLLVLFVMETSRASLRFELKTRRGRRDGGREGGNDLMQEEGESERRVQTRPVSSEQTL